MERSPLSLQDGCFLHLITHIGDFPPHALALLPRHLRSTLLHMAPPVYVIYLEKTAVASQIDMETIWKRIGERCQSQGKWPFYSSLLAESYECRDSLIAAIWDELLGGKWRNVSQKMLGPQDNWKMGFTLGSAMYAEFNHCLVENEIEAASQLMTLGIFPKVLEVMTTHVTLSRLWRNRSFLNQILQQCRPLHVKLWGGICIECILKGLAQCPQPELQELELYFTSSAVLSVIAHLFAQPNSFSLKKLIINLRQDTHLTESRAVIPPLVTIIRSQKDLQSMELAQMESSSCINAKASVNLAPILATLLQRPQFQSLKLISLKELPLHVVLSILEGFLLSQPENELHLSFENVGILHYKVDSQDSRRPPCLDPQQVILTGSKKYLSFRNMAIPKAVITWLCSMQCICFNTLYFHTYQQHASEIRKCFQSHPNFQVQNYKFQEFTAVNVPFVGW